MQTIAPLRNIPAGNVIGLGSMALQNSFFVSIFGGSIAGITDLAIADGGTGASTAAGARANLGFADGQFATTLTQVTNIAASSVQDMNYMRQNNRVAFSGRFTARVTTGSIASEIALSLPIASNFGLFTECSGNFSSPDQAGLGGSIQADFTNDRMSFKWIAGAGTSSYIFTYSGVYTII